MKKITLVILTLLSITLSAQDYFQQQVNYNINVELDDNVLDYYDSSKSYYYKMKETYTRIDFQKVLMKYIPDLNIILQSYNNKDIYKYIFNFNDVKRLFHRYSIDIKNIPPESNVYFKNLLSDNIKNYISEYESKYGKI